MPRALFLCSGTGSVGLPFREAGWEVTDVDWDGIYGAEIQTDITTWDYRAASEPGHFAVVWANPDCRMYSMARTTAKTQAILLVAMSWSKHAATLLNTCSLVVGSLKIPIPVYLKHGHVSLVCHMYA